MRLKNLIIRKPTERTVLCNLKIIFSGLKSSTIINEQRHYDVLRISLLTAQSPTQKPRESRHCGCPSMLPTIPNNPPQLATHLGKWKSRFNAPGSIIVRTSGRSLTIVAKVIRPDDGSDSILWLSPITSSFLFSEVNAVNYNMVIMALIGGYPGDVTRRQSRMC